MLSNNYNNSLTKSDHFYYEEALTTVAISSDVSKNTQLSYFLSNLVDIIMKENFILCCSCYVAFTRFSGIAG